MGKYRFRKVYFVCKDNSVMSDYQFVNCYREAWHAKEQEIYHQRKAMDEADKMWNQGKEMPRYKAEGFYLVPERLFEEVLKQFSKEGNELAITAKKCDK